MCQYRDVPFWEENSNKFNKDALNIILLAHVQEPRGHINTAQLQCTETERFSVEEFNEIYQGIVTAGYYIQSVYYNELDFISDYLDHPDRFKNCLIYNLARNGLGDNKKTIIPAFCELVGLNYSTSSSLACTLCRNKYYFSTLFHAHNIPVPASWLLDNNGNWVNGAPINHTSKVITKKSHPKGRLFGYTGGAGGSLGYRVRSKLSNGPFLPERWSRTYSTFSSTSLSISFFA